MTRLGFVLLYTRDVSAKLAFYEKAFGMERKYLSEDRSYGELAGETPVGFVQEDFVRQHGTDFVPARATDRPAAIEIGFVTDVDAAYRRALTGGATSLSPPAKRPWGQTVAYVRDDDGVLVEIATPWSVCLVPGAAPHPWAPARRYGRDVKRLTRLVSMALLLSARRRLTADNLAAHFAISLRTVYRDIAALEEAGFPVVGTAGDGYVLPAGAQARALALDEDEAEALVLAARILERSATDALALKLQAGVAKLEASLSPEAVRRLRDHRRTVIVPAGDQAKVGPLGVLLDAIHHRRVVQIHYDGVARAEATDRAIEPLGLVRLGNVWLLSAYCRLREDLRAFRSDRIRDAAPTGETFSDRPGMTLDDIVFRETGRKLPG